MEHYRRVLKNTNDIEQSKVADMSEYFGRVIEEAVQDLVGWYEDDYPHIHLIPGYEPLEEQQAKREAAVQILCIAALVLREAHEQVIKDISQIASEEQGITYRGCRVGSYIPEV
jgi:hypothetical protein